MPNIPKDCPECHSTDIEQDSCERSSHPALCDCKDGRYYCRNCRHTWQTLGGPIRIGEPIAGNPFWNM